MLVNAVIYTFPSARADEAQTLLQALRNASRAEAGCITFNVARSTDDPNAFVLYEEWKDQAALDFHYATPHFKQYGLEGIRPLASVRIGHRGRHID
jgi:quinol monooxygenase YgiN